MIHRYLSLIVLLAVACGLPLASADETVAHTGTIQGRVFDATTRESLIGANVVILGTNLGATADIEGRFTVKDVPAGSYRVQASYIGHVTLTKSDVVVSAGRMTELVFALQPTAVEIGEVNVRPSYFGEDNSAPVSSQSLSNEEIRRAPGGLEDVVRAISVLPGVMRVSAGRNDLIVRGGAASENLYMIDNLEVPNINHFGTQGATGGPLSFVNLDFVRDVTFTAGGFGAQYGDKLSSVTRIELEDGRSDRFGGKATLSASQFGLNTEGPLGKHGAFLFSARRSYLDFIFKSAGFSFVPEYWDFLGKATQRINAHNEISFLTIGTLDNVRFFNDTDDKRFDNSRVLGSSQQQYYSDFSWRYLFRGGYVTTSLGRTYSRFDYLQTDSLLAPVFESDSKEGQTSLRSDGVLVLPHRLELAVGAQAKSARLSGQLHLQPFATDFGDSLSSTASWERMGFKGAAYAQLSRDFTSRLRLSAGLRADYFDLIEDRSVLGPRLSLRYGLSGLTTLNLSGGTYYQAPSYIWLTANDGNRQLRYLRADQIVAGIEHLIRSDTKLRLEGYTKVYGDYPASLDRRYLVLSNTGAGFGGADEGFASFGFDRLSSRGRGWARGIELLAQKRLSEVRCYGIAALSYSQTDFEGTDGVVRPGLFDQRLIFNLSGGYKPDDRWEFSGRLRIGSGRPYTPFDESGGRDVTAFNGRRLPTFHSLDLRADRRWDFDRWNLVTYVDVQNVYNSRNVQGYRWNARESRVEASRDIGILPTVGVSAEF